MWTVFIASAVLLFFWVLTSPPYGRKVRTAPQDEDAYTKNRYDRFHWSIIWPDSPPRGGGINQLFGEMGKKTAADPPKKYPQFEENNQNCHIPSPFFYFLPQIQIVQFIPHLRHFTLIRQAKRKIFGALGLLRPHTRLKSGKKQDSGFSSHGGVGKKQDLWPEY